MFRDRTEGRSLRQKKRPQDELVRNIVKSCLNSTCAVLVCIIAFELYFYINCVNHAARFGWIGSWYRLCYLSLLLASSIGLGLIIYCRKDYDNRYRIMTFLSPIYSTIITVWALAVTYLDCLKSEKCSPIIIMTILLCIPACIYVNPFFFMTLNVIANIVMLCMLIWAPGGGDSADIYNYLVFMIIQTVVSRFFLTTKYSYYKSTQTVIDNEKKLAKSNEELKQLNEEIKTQMQIQMDLKIKEEKMAQQKKQAEEMTLLLIRTLSDTIEAKDEYTRGHSSRVSEYSALIAHKMGLPEEEVEKIKYAATLHDIGKIGVPDNILNKPSRLTDEEYEIIKTHSNIGADLLQNIDVISYTADIARHHHERYDGKGYPDGLTGEENSIGARIVAVSDAFDAMNSRRIYRNSLDRDIIIEEMQKNRGSQFDPEVVEAFLELMALGKIDEINVKESDFIKDEALSGEAINEDAEKILSAVVNTIKTSGIDNTKDILTGLLSRSIGEQKIVELMKEKPGAIVFCDMDNLKTINDRFGHKCGDKVLKILGEVIGQYESKGIACRVGGDEFLLYLHDVNESLVVKTIESISSDFNEAIKTDSTINIATISAGIYLTNPTDLYSDALSKVDKALYHVKQNGKAEYYIYRDEIDEYSADNHADIEQVARIIKDAGEYDGALDVEYRQFAKMFDYLNKLCERYDHSCNIVLVTLDEKNKGTMYIDDIELGMKHMEKAIKNTIRNVDICTRYSSVQFLIILVEAGDDNVDAIMNRIFSSFYKMNAESDLVPRYEVRVVN